MEFLLVLTEKSELSTMGKKIEVKTIMPEMKI
jgi:hypothetical protein